MNVLIIDDDLGIRETLGMALEASGHTVAAVVNRAAAEKKLRAETYEVAFLDIRLGAENGLDILPELLRLSPRLAIIMITAYASVETAVMAIQRGAFDYLPKPFKPAQIEQVLERVVKTRRLEARITELEAQLVNPGMDVELESTADPATRELLALVKKGAGSNATVLIQGESGTGKSVLARKIHQWSPRAKEPFITVSCPSLSKELLESELFGHIKGSFTGAIATTWGKVAAADRGTLFLDEIGELPLEVQPKLLRLLQERTYERVGESKIHMADVRVIAATNRDLKQTVAAGAFREDLLYRLDVFSLRMPALRERSSDILAIAESQLRELATQAGKSVTGFTEEARVLLQRYPWPGNIRELRNAIERALILCAGDVLDVRDFPATLTGIASTAPFLGGEYSTEEIEAEHIRQVLARKTSIQDAAEVLKMDRSTLLRKRKRKSLGL